MKNYHENELTCACEYCESASEVCDGDAVLCSRHGMVGREHICRRFSYDPLKRRPAPFRMPDNIDVADLLL